MSKSMDAATRAAEIKKAYTIFLADHPDDALWFADLQTSLHAEIDRVNRPPSPETQQLRVELAEIIRTCHERAKPAGLED